MYGYACTIACNSELMNNNTLACRKCEFSVKIEALYALTNSLICASPIRIRECFVKHGTIKAICDMLDCVDEDAIYVILRGLENIFKAGDPDPESLVR